MTNKINSKYNILIWLGLIFSCFIRDSYVIYSEFSALVGANATTITIQVVLTLLINGLLGAAIIYFIAFIAHMIGARRYVSCISRFDFTSIVMIAMMGSNVLLGIVDLFSLLSPMVNYFTASFGYLVALVALLLVYFLVIVKKYNLNPVEKYNSFKLWFTFFVVFIGFSVITQDLAILVIADLGTAPEFSEIIGELLYMYGEELVIDSFTQAVSIASICVYVAVVIGFVVMVQVFKSKASKYRSPEGRSEYYKTHVNRPYQQRNDLNPFDEFNQSSSPNGNGNSSNDGNVFDEFDI